MDTWKEIREENKKGNKVEERISVLEKIIYQQFLI